MAKEWAKSFYNSTAWRKCREGYIASVNGLCERCQEKGMIKPGYIVHHIEELTPDNINNPEITLSWDKLEYLCQDCHNQEHHGKDVTEEGLTFNSSGQLVKEKGRDYREG